MAASVPLTKLTIAKITCANCLEPIMADISRTAQAGPLLPDKCPTCHHRIPTGLHDDVGALRDLYFRHERKRNPIEFLIKA